MAVRSQAKCSAFPCQGGQKHAVGSLTSIDGGAAETRKDLSTRRAPKSAALAHGTYQLSVVLPSFCSLSPAMRLTRCSSTLSGTGKTVVS
jgi:hypothetical protein